MTRTRSPGILALALCSVSGVLALTGCTVVDGGAAGEPGPSAPGTSVAPSTPAAGGSSQDTPAPSATTVALTHNGFGKVEVWTMCRDAIVKNYAITDYRPIEEARFSPNNDGKLFVSIPYGPEVPIEPTMICSVGGTPENPVVEKTVENDI
jgi:hypothetical protein